MVMSMEIKIGVASVRKSGAEYCGDSFCVAERPDGGMALILADGHGNTPAAQQTSRWVAQRARGLLLEGKRDEAIARAIHEELYEMTERKVACALTILGVDREAETAVIGRSGAMPVLVYSPDYETLYDEEATLLGMSRSVNPQTYELPLAQGMIFAAYTEGVRFAGRKSGMGTPDPEHIWEFLRKNPASDVEFIAESILDYAVKLDKSEPSEDMTVAVLGVAEATEKSGVCRLSAAYPFSLTTL